MTTYKERLFTEHSDLTIKLTALAAFLMDKAFDKLPYIDRMDLREQYGHMKEYHRVLSYRVSRACNGA